MKINFHIHTNYSDGAINPSQMVHVMKEKKFDCIALTDHDTAEGNFETSKLCKDCGIKFIPGIEITSYLDSTIGLYDDSYKVHVLGLNISSDQVAIELKRVEERKIEYHKRVMTDFISNSKLNTSIVDFSNRVSCAKLLYSLGAVDSMESAMSIFKVSPYALSIKDTIKCIHSAGGIAIWAHPFLLPKNGGFRITEQEVTKIYQYMREQQIDGMEGFYLQFSQEDQDFLKSICEKNKAFCSTGTDFHADYDFEYDLLDVTGRIDKHLLKALDM